MSIVGFMDWASCVNCVRSNFDPDDAEVPQCGMVNITVHGNDVVCKNYYTGDIPVEGDDDAEVE